MGFGGNVRHRDHSHEIVVFVHHRNAAHLLVAHHADDIHDAVVWPDGVWIDRHDVFGASVVGVFTLRHGAYRDVAVGDQTDEFAARVGATVVLAIVAVAIFHRPAVTTDDVVLNHRNHTRVFLFHQQCDLRQRRLASRHCEILGHDVAAAQARTLATVLPTIPLPSR